MESKQFQPKQEEQTKLKNPLPTRLRKLKNQLLKIEQSIECRIGSMIIRGTSELSMRRMALATVATALLFVAAYYLSSYLSLFYAMAALSAIAGFSAAYIVAKVMSYLDKELAQSGICGGDVRVE